MRDDEHAYIESAAASLDDRTTVAMPRPHRATGYAVRTKAGIDVRSICDSEPGAAVNWLTTACGLIATGALSGKIILETFKRAQAIRDDAPEIVRVEIRELLQ